MLHHSLSLRQHQPCRHRKRSTWMRNRRTQDILRSDSLFDVQFSKRQNFQFSSLTTSCISHCLSVRYHRVTFTAYYAKLSKNTALHYNTFQSDAKQMQHSVVNGIPKHRRKFQMQLRNPLSLSRLASSAHSGSIVLCMRARVESRRQCLRSSVAAFTVNTCTFFCQENYVHFHVANLHGRWYRYACHE